METYVIIKSGLVLHLTGIIMMTAYHGVLMHALWLKIKMVILALIIITQLFICRPAIRKL